MKHLIFTTFIFFVLVSCRKEIKNLNEHSGYIKNVRAALKDSIPANDFATLDFNRAVLSKVDSVQLFFLRIPFKEKNLQNDFVIVKTNADGKINAGKIVHLDGTSKTRRFNGNISVSSLDRSVRLSSPVSNGYIEALHPQRNLRTLSMEPVYPEGVVLPEVIVVAYITTNTGVSFSDWVLLQSLFYDYGGGGGGSYYGSMDGNGGGYYDGGGGSGSVDPYYSGFSQDPVIEIEEEYIYDLQGIDINKFFKCFDNVPSGGAFYSIRLCSDIPSNSNPNTSANFSAASGGHSFLIITKTNGSTSVTQSFGFYPSTTPSWFDPFAPVSSTLKDNGAQEINASIEMNITESQFNIVKQNAISWSTKNYDLADFNCSDYAIDVFNSIRTSPLIISDYKIILPGNTNPWAPADPISVTINKSPQMLFMKLQEMKNNNNIEAANIVIDQTHGYRAPISKGECN
jgi:hypothetical protein